MYFSLGSLIWETNTPVSSTVKIAKKLYQGCISWEGNCTKGHSAHSIYVDRIPNSVSQGVFVQECLSEHQQGGQASDGTESERKKERVKEWPVWIPNPPGTSCRPTAYCNGDGSNAWHGCPRALLGSELSRAVLWEGRSLTRALFAVSLSLPFLLYHKAVSLVPWQVCFGICSRRCCVFSQKQASRDKGSSVSNESNAKVETRLSCLNTVIAGMYQPSLWNVLSYRRRARKFWIFSI